MKRYLLEKMHIWINGLLEAERDDFLGWGRHEALDEKHDNYRNGYRPRSINFFGLGRIQLWVPRDRRGEFESGWLLGLEGVFKRFFPRARTQRRQKHAKANACRQVRKAEREEFSKDLNKVFYAVNEAAARTALFAVKDRWGEAVPVGGGENREGCGLIADVLSVRRDALDGVADDESD